MTLDLQLYLIASLINITLGLSGWIQFFIRTLSYWQDKEFHSALDTGTSTTPEKLHLFGRVIGIFECQFYLYGLFTDNDSLITGILAFKAFTGWIRFNATSHEDEIQNSPLQEQRQLQHFYRYTIGNFLSLASAIVIYELVIRLG